MESRERPAFSARSETYAGAKHGWVPTDSAVYDRDASERHFETLLALFDATLKNAPPKA
jgi:carboxymethylenebutenolidase